MTEHTLTIRRQFAASPERVYDAWTDPGLFAAWIGPVGIPCDVLEMQPVVGGRYDLAMLLPDGTRMTVGGTYTALRRPDLIAFTWGNPQRAVLMQIVITLRSSGTGTEMEFVQHDLPDADSHASHGEGWESAFTKLQSFLEP